MLCNLIIGVLLMAAFVTWEWKYAPMPMVPHEMFTGQRIVAMAYGIAFVAGGHCRLCDIPHADIVRHELLCDAEFLPNPLRSGLRSPSNPSGH